MDSKKSYSFLAFGKTAESKETQEFKRYIGVGSTKVITINPDKKTLDALMGYDSQNEPEYTGVNNDNVQFARITFIVETDPEQCNGIDIKNRLTFTLYNAPAYNRDKTKVQVIDIYGNTTWAAVEDAKAGNKLLSASGNPLRIADKYRTAYQGEADLVAFLKTYLCVDSAFNYVNGVWTLKDNASDSVFGLEHIKDYFSGNFSEIKEALKLQPNNKVKLLYGVRTTDEGRQYQAIATRENLMLRNSAGASALARLDKELQNVKQAGGYSNTEFKVQDLVEYDVQPTDLSKASNDDPLGSAPSSDMPWD